MLAIILCQSLLTFSIDGDAPVRFGVPIPARQLTAGLRLQHGGADATFQWSLLQPGADPRDGTTWIEIAIDGASGRCALAAGGAPSSSAEGGEAVRCARETAATPEGETRVATWTWPRSGASDRVERIRCAVAGTTASAETLEPGEWTSTGLDALALRRTRVAIDQRLWRRAGVLPADLGIGKDLRLALLDVVDDLPPAPGVRGRGDYIRGTPETGIVVTNLEFDTALGFAQLALATGRADLLTRAWECAWHTLDRDIDLRSGLTFRHGTDHRSALPEAGHCWLRGMLLTGCLFADRALIDGALDLGRSLAQHVSSRERVEVARDVGWPLGELEAMLRFCDDKGARDACDRLAGDLLARWDASNGVFRFPEGGDGPVYKERCWQTGGVVLPGLRAFVARTGSARGAEVLACAERRLLALIRDGKPGLPLSYRVRDAEVFDVGRRSATPAGVMLLEGLQLADLRAALTRTGVQRALDGVLRADAPELATDFSIVARCEWVMR